MSCEETTRLLDAYLDGELDLAGSLEIEKHLETCDACRQRLAARETLVGAIHEKAPYFEAPGYLKTRIRASLGDSAPAARPSWLRLIFQPGWASLSKAAAALAVLVLYILVLLKPGVPLTDEAIANHIRSLQVAHLMDVVSTDQHTVKPWFAGKLDFSPQVIDLSSSGFPLIGGRLDVLDHRTVAAIIYQRRKHYINLFVWPANESPARASLREQNGYRVLAWSKSGMNYVAVSDVATPDFQTFTDLVKQRTE